MRYLVLITAALLSGQALAGTDCKPVAQAPVTISLVAQQGVTTMRSTEKLVNTPDPQTFTSPNFTFSVVAVSNCADGLEIKLLQKTGDSQHLLRWNQPTVVNGKAGTDHHITITAKRVR